MVYTIIGIVMIVIVAILFSADKFATHSEFMSSFKKGTFEKIVAGFSIVAVLFISYGIYYQVTYQPPFIDVSVNGSNYTIFGDIGEAGYYADGLVEKNEEVTIHLVSWKELQLRNKAEIIVSYPSGKDIIWAPNVTLLEGSSVQSVKNEHEIEEIYELAPYTFKESGNVKITVDDVDFTIEVRQPS